MLALTNLTSFHHMQRPFIVKNTLLWATPSPSWSAFALVHKFRVQGAERRWCIPWLSNRLCGSHFTDRQPEKCTLELGCTIAAFCQSRPKNHRYIDQSDRGRITAYCV